MKSITAIICITLIIMFAVWQGHDGALVGIATSAIAGIAGYNIHKAVDSKRQKSNDKE